ncbi:hypothetical protein RJ639_034601, partial [Escallonia herrerae]
MEEDRRKPLQVPSPSRTPLRLLVPLLSAVLIALTTVIVLVALVAPSKLQLQNRPLTVLLELPQDRINKSTNSQAESKAEHTTIQPTTASPTPRKSQNPHARGGPYHDWELFEADYNEMLRKLKIFVYPDAFDSGTSPFANIFMPYSNPFHPKLGNYLSEHAFKVALLRSELVTDRPEEADLFFMPFSINAMRNDPRLHSTDSISGFVANYTHRIGSEFKFWNASSGSDHFYVCCHSIGREAASKHRELLNNAIQVTCSSSYFQRLYISHKDVGLPQVWPRQPEPLLSPPDERDRLVFFAGRIQNARVRQELLALWGNDSSMDMNPSFPYEQGFRRSKYCLHVKGYEVNTARISDAIHYGCVPVLISNYYDLPLANVLDWSKFSITIHEADIVFLKRILLAVPGPTYSSMYQNLEIVRKHFAWNTNPGNYDSFYMTAYQLWLRRGLHRLSRTKHRISGYASSYHLEVAVFSQIKTYIDANSDGLRIAAHPAARAGATFHVAISI